MGEIRYNVMIHGMATPRSNQAIEHLLKELNAAEFNYPGTNLRLVYTLATGAEKKVIPNEPKSKTGVT